MTPRNRKQLRLQIRQARKDIPANYARQASYKFSERIAEQPAYQNANRVAGFLAFDGEADPAPLMDRAIQENKLVFVPIIVGKEKPLLFAPWTRQSRLKKNAVGILEPDVPQAQLIEAHELECVITPLVVFDENCNRIGVGGGFYDRSFAFLQQAPESSTVLIGMAYEMQKVDKIEVEPWDIRLNAIVTELAVYTP